MGNPEKLIRHFDIHRNADRWQQSLPFFCRVECKSAFVASLVIHLTYAVYWSFESEPKVLSQNEYCDYLFFLLF